MFLNEEENKRLVESTYFGALVPHDGRIRLSPTGLAV